MSCFTAMLAILTFGTLTACAAEGSVALASEAVGDAQYSGVMSAAVEAVYTLAAFFAVGLVIHVMQQRNMKNVRMRNAAQKAKAIEVSVPDDSTQTLPPQACRRKADLARSGSAPCRRDGDCDALIAAVRGGRAAELPSLLASARADGLARGLVGDALASVVGQLLQHALRACASRRCFREALAAYDDASAAEEGIAICGSTWSVLLYCSVEAQEFWRCGVIIERLIGNIMPSSNDFVNIVRYFSHESDADGLKRAILLMEGKGFVLDNIGRNRALSACTANRALELAEVLAGDDVLGAKMDVIGYNTLMKCYLEVERPWKCLEAYDAMRRRGEAPSEVTFGVLLDACNDNADADRAAEIFKELRVSGLKTNVIHYTTFMKVLAKVGRLEAANALLDEMLCAEGVKPDMVTYTTLVKANTDRGNLASAMRVLEKMREHGTTPDGVIFHIALGGCVVEAMESRLVLHVFQQLVSYGMKCTTTTLSILLKALAKSRDWDGALDVLERAPLGLKLYPEVRLFAQLAQASASAGAGEKTLDCYFAMIRSATLRGFAIDEATSLRLCRHCSDAREARMAAKVHALVMASHGPVALEDLQALAQQRPVARRRSTWHARVTETR